jgi:hypothetical protein
MAPDPKGNNDQRQRRVARRLQELREFASTRLVGPGEDANDTTAFYVAGELLTNRPDVVVRTLGRRGVRSRKASTGCSDVSKVKLPAKHPACATDVATQMDQLVGDDAYVTVNHVLLLAPVTEFGPGGDPEPVEAADPACPPLEGVEWGIAVVDSGLFSPEPPHLVPAALPVPTETEVVDFDGGGIVDFSATAHGGFIAGIIQRMTGIVPMVRDVASRDYLRWTFGIRESDVISDVEVLLRDETVKLVNLSLGTYATEEKTRERADISAMRFKLRRWVKHRPDVLFVCAAGNDGTDRPWYPAAFAADPDLADHVVPVGALANTPLRPDPGADRAAFSNFGDWVTAWAPGVDHQSDYPADVTYVYGPNQHDPTAPRASFAGYAKWSGTSFAAPYAAAEIARVAAADGVLPQEAWARLRKEGRTRFPLEGSPCARD